jgi:hypothetical protein
MRDGGFPLIEQQALADSAIDADVAQDYLSGTELVTLKRIQTDCPEALNHFGTLYNAPRKEAADHAHNEAEAAQSYGLDSV